MSRLLVFGYGSILAPCGLNHRNMARHYKRNELVECHLNNHRRSFSAVYNPPFSVWDELEEGYGYEKLPPIRYFGVNPEVGARVNGIIFEISRKDWPAFVRSEGGGLIYSFPNVTKHITGFDLRHGDIVTTCMTLKPSKAGIVTNSYINRCQEALNQRSSAFQKEFGDIRSYLP